MNNWYSWKSGPFTSAFRTDGLTRELAAYRQRLYNFFTDLNNSYKLYNGHLEYNDADGSVRLVNDRGIFYGNGRVHLKTGGMANYDTKTGLILYPKEVTLKPVDVTNPGGDNPANADTKDKAGANPGKTLPAGTRGSVSSTPTFRNLAAAVNYYRKKGKGVFNWRGKVYNTMTKNDTVDSFRRAHADYDAFLGNLAHDQGGWKVSDPTTLANKLNGVPDEVKNPISTPTFTPTFTPKVTATAPTASKLSMFTDDDIRNLGFNNYSGLVKAASNKANANNNFIKALTLRYGADTSKWDQKTIESDLGVRGKYRSFGRGDFGDMSRSMASWMGTYNGNIDRLEKIWNRNAGVNYSLNNSTALASKYQLQKPQLNASFNPQNTVSTSTPSTPQNSTLSTNFKYVVQPKEQSESTPWDLFKFKNGGTIYKYLQGGEINMDEQQLQQAFLQYLMQKTGAQSEQQLQEVMQQMGEDGLKQAYAQFLQEMLQQQVQAAKFGAKLNYIKRLNGKCPEGMQMHYFKSGGRLCRKCMKIQEKETKKPSNPIDAFKCGRKLKNRKG